MITNERWIAWIDNAAAVIDRNIKCADAGDLKHGDQQRCFVFAVTVPIAEDVGGVVRLETADAAHHHEITNVVLDEFGDATEL